MKLVRAELLRHIEGYSEKRVKNMMNKILESKIWERPICIEKKYFLILDGQHRFEVAKSLGLNYVPCEFFDYNDKDVITWSLRKDCIVSKELVIQRTLNGNPYPYKTAKHKFPRNIKKCMIPLGDLEHYSKTYKSNIVHYRTKSGGVYK